MEESHLHHYAQFKTKLCRFDCANPLWFLQHLTRTQTEMQVGGFRRNYRVALFSPHTQAAAASPSLFSMFQLPWMPPTYWRIPPAGKAFLSCCRRCDPRRRWPRGAAVNAAFNQAAAAATSEQQSQICARPPFKRLQAATEEAVNYRPRRSGEVPRW